MKTSIDNWSKGVGEKVSVVLCAVATDERAWVGERAEVGGPGSGPRRAANRLHTFFMRQREQAAQQSVGLKEQGVRSREQSYRVEGWRAESAGGLGAAPVGRLLCGLQ